MGLQNISYFAVFAVLCAGSRSFEINKSGCDKTKGCISFPSSCTSSEDCNYLVTFVPGEDTVAFEMSARNEYIGFGLNEQQVMLGTDAVVCSKTTSHNGTVLVGYYILPNHRPPTILKPTPSGLTNIYGVYENGIIRCRFNRSIRASPPLKYSLNASHYLIYARGPTKDNGDLRYHVWRSFSSKRQKLTYKGAVPEASLLLAALHAGLMILAWVGFASVGMFTARNMKRVLAGETCCELKNWFQVHRTSMLLTTLNHLGFCGDFCVQRRLVHQGAHGIIGIIVVSLTTLQPIIAVFRPSKESERRYVFKWFHLSIAMVCFILAMTNCFLGLRLLGLPMTTHQGFYILLGFISFYSVIALLCEVHSMYENTKENDTGLLSAEVLNKSTGDVEEKTTKDTEGEDSVLLIMAYVAVVLIAAGVCVAFISILALSVRDWDRS